MPAYDPNVAAPVYDQHIAAIHAYLEAHGGAATEPELSAATGITREAIRAPLLQKRAAQHGVVRVSGKARVKGAKPTPAIWYAREGAAPPPPPAPPEPVAEAAPPDWFDADHPAPILDAHAGKIAAYLDDHPGPVTEAELCDVLGVPQKTLSNRMFRWRAQARHGLTRTPGNRITKTASWQRTPPT